ncbi:MAG: peptidylprolyl isomerase [Actinobacteria bacterium]|nr:peptidylprolyl isomerase [Actinomycetota bacterium]
MKKKDLKKVYHWDDEEIINEKEETKEIQRAKKKTLKNQPKPKIVQETKKGLTKTAKILISVVSVIVVLAVAAGVIFGYFGYKFDFSKTLATVNDASIKQNAVDTYVEFLKNQDPTSVPADNTPEFKTLQANILDSLIVLNVLENYGAKNNFKVTQKEIDDAYQNIVKNYPSESDFEKDLVAKKISKDFLMSQIKSQVLSNKIFTDVTKNITISDAEVKKYYDDNKETLFKVPEQIQVSHILIKFNVPEGQELNEQLKKEAYDKIKAIQDKLKNGEDFAALAKSYSEDTASKENGGDIGLISAGQTIKEFEDAAFALKVGEVSDVTETTYGYHLIKVTDHKDPYIKDFGEVTDSIKSYLLNSRQSGEWDKFVSELILKTNIIYTTDLKGALLDINKNNQGTGTSDTPSTGTSSTDSTTGSSATTGTTGTEDTTGTT